MCSGCKSRYMRAFRDSRERLTDGELAGGPRARLRRHHGAGRRTRLRSGADLLAAGDGAELGLLRRPGLDVSGGQEVPSSNLGAPTREASRMRGFSLARANEVRDAAVRARRPARKRARAVNGVEAAVVEA